MNSFTYPYHRPSLPPSILTPPGFYQPQSFVYGGYPSAYFVPSLPLPPVFPSNTLPTNPYPYSYCSNETVHLPAAYGRRWNTTLPRRPPSHPSQFQRASFVAPHSRQETEPEPKPTQPAMTKASDALERVVSALTERVGKQETRIRELENELMKHQIDCQLASPASSSPRKSPASTVEPIADLISLDAVEETPTFKDSNLELLLGQFPVASRFSSASSATENIDLLNLLGDEMAAQNNAYLADNWAAFEQHLAKLGELPKYVMPAPEKVDDSLETLIEGVGSIEELTVHDKNEKVKYYANGLISEPVPWDGTIKWGKDAAELLHIAPYGFPSGIIYDPDEGEDNVFRTVTVRNLHLRMCMRTFMKGVRGGEVYSVQITNMARLAGYHIAKITFVRDEAAENYVKYVAERSVTYDHQRITAGVDMTPTYPMSEDMEDCIFKEGHTRCISIRGPVDEKREEIVVAHLWAQHIMLAVMAERVVENESKTEIIVRLHSIEAAQKVLRTLKVHPKLAGCEFDFAADPCARPFPDGSKENPYTVY